MLAVPFYYAEVQIPQYNATAVKSVGRPVYPYHREQRGNTSRLLDYLIAEAGRLWPDPYDNHTSSRYHPVIERIGFMDVPLDKFLGEENYQAPKDEAALWWHAAALPVTTTTELRRMLMAVAPCNAGFLDGRWWGKSPPECIMCHTVLVPGKAFRMMVWKALGWWHWRVSHLVKRSFDRPGPLEHSTKETPLPPMLALAPFTSNTTVPTRAEWQTMAIHLIVVRTCPCPCTTPPLVHQCYGIYLRPMR